MTDELLRGISVRASALAGDAKMNATEEQRDTLEDIATKTRTLADELASGPSESRRKQIVSAGKQLEVLYDRTFALVSGSPFGGGKGK